jgi:heptosyltransferase-2
LASITNRILLIAPQWIGDAVMTEPLVRSLRALGASLTVAALPHIAPVYSAMSGIDQITQWSFKRGKLQIKHRWLTAQTLINQFDQAIICPNSFKAALIPYFAKIPIRVGYKGEFRSMLLTHTLANPNKHHREPMVQIYKKLAVDANTNELQPPLPKLLLDAGNNPVDSQDFPRFSVAKNYVNQTLESFALVPENYYVLAPGAEYGPAKRWPLENFVQIAIQEQSKGIHPVILGSPGDLEAGEIIEEQCKLAHVEVINLVGKTHLLQAIHIISSAKFVLSNDSGLMHIAAALRRPQVAVFGSSSPLHTPPLSPLAKVLWLGLECAPCFERTCPLGHYKCLKELTVQQVEAGIQQVLSG